MKYGKTDVVVCEDEHDLGRRVAADVAACLRQLLGAQDEVRVIFAGGESQMTFQNALVAEPGVEWSRVVCFNMDDFWEPCMPAEFAVSNQTVTFVYDKVHPKAYHVVNFAAANPEAEARRYEAFVRAAGPIDILCQGIGRSGHLAFNEPGQTRFDDECWVRVVELAAESEQQLLEDPNFMGLGYVPKKGITMTIPALMSAQHKFTIVPLASKRPIMSRVLAAETATEEIPATIIRNYEGKLYLDENSYPG
jgi:glucosamine-6-phosphate deaminase